MLSSFVLCTGCTRHVKAHEPACPFCGAAPSPLARSNGEPLLRIAAAAAVAAGVAAAASDCSPPSTSVYYGSPFPTLDASEHDGTAADGGADQSAASQGDR
jgi:hypothetical protein